MNTHLLVIEPLEARIAPATIIVNTTGDTSHVFGKTSLRDALESADNHPGPDTIIFHLQAPPPHDENRIILSNGELTSNGNVTIKGPGKLIIDANGTHRAFDFNDANDPTHSSDSPVSMSGLTIINGKAANYGGAIYSTESLTLKNMTISGNDASGGGGVEVFGNATAGTKVSISTSLITGNTCQNYGAGLNLYHLTSLKMTKTVVSGNTAAHNAGGGMIAGINSTGTGMAITNCTFADNQADHGGGLVVNDYNTATTSKTVISGTKITGNSCSSKTYGGGGLIVDAGNTVITSSTISDNSAVYDGGGIEAIGFLSLTISSSTIADNKTTKTGLSAHGGGGLFVMGNGSATPKPVKVAGSHFTGNESKRDGGGIMATEGISLTISASTFSGNTADEGGGVGTAGTGVNRVDLHVSGSTFSDNVAGYIVVTSGGEGGVGEGGAIYATGGGAVTISSSKATGNFAGISGGGFFLKSTGLVTVKNVVVSNNVASPLLANRTGGGGMVIDHTPGFQVTGSTFKNNTGGYGGGIFLYDSGGGGSSILNTTISGNTAGRFGGGVYNLDPGATGVVTLQIAKVTGNSAPTGADVTDDAGDLSTFNFV